MVDFFPQGRRVDEEIKREWFITPEVRGKLKNKSLFALT